MKERPQQSTRLTIQSQGSSRPGSSAATSRPLPAPCTLTSQCSHHPEWAVHPLPPPLYPLAKLTLKPQHKPPTLMLLGSLSLIPLNRPRELCLVGFFILQSSFGVGIARALAPPSGLSTFLGRTCAASPSASLMGPRSGHCEVQTGNKAGVEWRAPCPTSSLTTGSCTACHVKMTSWCLWV